MELPASGQPPCKRCHRTDPPLGRIECFDRITLADDPADPDYGHYHLESVHVLRCPACGHRQERVVKRTPYASLREAQKEMDAHILGKG